MATIRRANNQMDRAFMNTTTSTVQEYARDIFESRITDTGDTVNALVHTDIFVKQNLQDQIDALTAQLATANDEMSQINILEGN